VVTCAGLEVTTGTSLSGTVLADAGCCRPASSCNGVVSAERSGLAGTSSEAMVFLEMAFPEIDPVASGESLSGPVLAGAGCCRPASSCDAVVSAELSGLAVTSSEAVVFPEMVFPETDPVDSGESSCSEALEWCPTRVLLPLDVLRGEYGGTSLGVYGGGGPEG
jgi:predicted metal-binding transcription factor (methanogenesis marker protein 9)